MRRNWKWGNLTNEKTEILDKFRYDSIEDKIYSSAPIVADLNSYYLGDLWKISSWGNKILNTNLDTDIHYSAVKSGIKGQEKEENRDSTWIIKPFTQTYSDNLIMWQLTWELGTNIVDYNKETTPSFDISVWGVNIVLGEALPIWTKLKYTLLAKESGEKLYVNDYTTTKALVQGEAFDLWFDKPLEVEKDDAVFGHIHVKEGGLERFLQVYSTTDGTAYSSVFYRTYENKNIALKDDIAEALLWNEPKWVVDYFNDLPANANKGDVWEVLKSGIIFIGSNKGFYQAQKNSPFKEESHIGWRKIDNPALPKYTIWWLGYANDNDYFNYTPVNVRKIASEACHPLGGSVHRHFLALNNYPALKKETMTHEEGLSVVNNLALRAYVDEASDIKIFEAQTKAILPSGCTFRGKLDSMDMIPTSWGSTGAVGAVYYMENDSADGTFPKWYYRSRAEAPYKKHGIDGWEHLNTEGLARWSLKRDNVDNYPQAFTPMEILRLTSDKYAQPNGDDTKLFKTNSIMSASDFTPWTYHNRHYKYAVNAESLVAYWNRGISPYNTRLNALEASTPKAEKIIKSTIQIYDVKQRKYNDNGKYIGSIDGQQFRISRFACPYKNSWAMQISIPNVKLHYTGNCSFYEGGGYRSVTVGTLSNPTTWQEDDDNESTTGSKPYALIGQYQNRWSGVNKTDSITLGMMSHYYKASIIGEYVVHTSDHYTSTRKTYEISINYLDWGGNDKQGRAAEIRIRLRQD